MKRKRKKSVRVFPKPVVETGFDYWLNHFDQPCEVCGQPLVFHAFRKASQKYDEAVYASCTNRGVCRNFGREMVFIGLKGGRNEPRPIRLSEVCGNQPDAVRASA